MDIVRDVLQQSGVATGEFRLLLNNGIDQLRRICIFSSLPACLIVFGDRGRQGLGCSSHGIAGMVRDCGRRHLRVLSFFANFAGENSGAFGRGKTVDRSTDFSRYRFRSLFYKEARR